MTSHIYRTIADSFLGVEIEYEYRRIDAVLRSKEGTPDSIVVAMEHENNVQSINKELWELHSLGCPLSVVITYTGARAKYLNDHSDAMNRFSDGTLLLIVNAEKWNPCEHSRGEAIPWEFLLWSEAGLVAI